MARIKVTGYLEVEDDEFDPDHPTGLTAAAYDEYCGPESGITLADLESLETEPA